MSTVISVENLGKKYTLRHQQRDPYTALRDVITNGVAIFTKKLLSPFTIHMLMLRCLSTNRSLTWRNPQR